MGYYVIGGIGFLLFVLYDWNQAGRNFTYLKPLFGVGCLLIAAATVGLWVSESFDRFNLPLLLQSVFWILTFMSGALLVYTLFFAVPFKQAYIEGSRQEIMTEGVYALCRHPGIWFLFFLYVFSGLAGGRFSILIAGVLFSFMNLGYVFLQDRHFFPKIFSGYTAYQQRTGFLIPTRNSIRQCVRYYKKQRQN